MVCRACLGSRVPLRSLQPFTTRLFFSGHSDFRRRRDPRRTLSRADAGAGSARPRYYYRFTYCFHRVRILYYRLENIFRYFMQAKMTCRMFRPFSGTFSLACLGPSSWQQKCIGPSGSCNEPPRKQGRPVRRKQRQDGTDCGQLALHTQAAFGARACRRLPKALAHQPRPISRVVCAGRPHRPCFRASGIALRRHGSEWREVVVCDVRRARARRHDGHLE